jgi:DNA polymerase-3 subunit alpha
VGQTNLFGVLERVSAPKEASQLYPDIEEWPTKVCLSYEKECLGFYVSGHPLDRYVHDIRRIRCTPLASIAESAHRTSVTVAGVITSVRERTLRTGSGRMAFISLEDLTGRAEVVVFSKLFETAEELIKGDEPLVLQAVVQHEGDGDAMVVRLRAESVSTLREVREQQSKRVTLAMDADLIQPELMERLEAYLTDWQDGFPVDVILTIEGYGEARVTLGGQYRLEADDTAVERVERLIGKGNVVFH